MKCWKGSGDFDSILDSKARRQRGRDQIEAAQGKVRHFWGEVWAQRPMLDFSGSSEWLTATLR